MSKTQVKKAAGSGTEAGEGPKEYVYPTLKTALFFVENGCFPTGLNPALEGENGYYKRFFGGVREDVRKVLEVILDQVSDDLGKDILIGNFRGEPYGKRGNDDFPKKETDAFYRLLNTTLDLCQAVTLITEWAGDKDCPKVIKEAVAKVAGGSTKWPCVRPSAEAVPAALAPESGLPEVLRNCPPLHSDQAKHAVAVLSIIGAVRQLKGFKKETLDFFKQGKVSDEYERVGNPVWIEKVFALSDFSEESVKEWCEVGKEILDTEAPNFLEGFKNHYFKQIDTSTGKLLPYGERQSMAWKKTREYIERLSRRAGQPQA